MRSSIYVVRAGRYFKVGRSKDVEKRIKDLQVANPHQLVLILRACGDRTMEKRLHRLLRRWHVRGEWFAIPPDIIEEIQYWHPRILPDIDKIIHRYIRWHQGYPPPGW